MIRKLLQQAQQGGDQRFYAAVYPVIAVKPEVKCIVPSQGADGML